MAISGPEYWRVVASVVCAFHINRIKNPVFTLKKQLGSVAVELLKAVSVMCPYCGDATDITVDCSIDFQHYIEDCVVCCRPISFSVSVDEHYDVQVNAQHENE